MILAHLADSLLRRHDKVDADDINLLQAERTRADVRQNAGVRDLETLTIELSLLI